MHPVLLTIINIFLVFGIISLIISILYTIRPGKYMETAFLISSIIIQITAILTWAHALYNNMGIQSKITKDGLHRIP
jgi:hypothetical protein